MVARAAALRTEVTVTSLHPPRLCRTAVFSVKPTFLSSSEYPYTIIRVRAGCRQKCAYYGQGGHIVLAAVLKSGRQLQYATAEPEHGQ